MPQVEDTGTHKGVVVGIGSASARAVREGQDQELDPGDQFSVTAVWPQAPVRTHHKLQTCCSEKCRFMVSHFRLRTLGVGCGSHATEAGATGDTTESQCHVKMKLAATEGSCPVRGRMRMGGRRDQARPGQKTAGGGAQEDSRPGRGGTDRDGQ